MNEIISKKDKKFIFFLFMSFWKNLIINMLNLKYLKT